MNRLYWLLPYETRRKLFKFNHPEKYEYLARLRAEIPIQLNQPTFKPFIDNKCIFVHIPKAAGISIGYSIFDRHTGNHTTIEEYQIAFSKTEFKSFFKFTFVRNPFDRLFSAFHFIKNGGRNPADATWAKEYLFKIDNFEEFVLNWVNEENILKGIHFAPQYKFITTPASPRKPLVDFVGRFENINNDFQHIRQQLGMGTDLIFENKSNKKGDDYRKHYNDKMVDIVSSTYKDDIELLNYTFSE